MNTYLLDFVFVPFRPAVVTVAFAADIYSAVLLPTGGFVAFDTADFTSGSKVTASVVFVVVVVVVVVAAAAVIVVTKRSWVQSNRPKRKWEKRI